MDPHVAHLAAKELKHGTLDLTAACLMMSNAQIGRALVKVREARLELALRLRCLDHLLGHPEDRDRRCSCKPEEIAAAMADYQPDPEPQQSP